jgi:hypothetical protein
MKSKEFSGYIYIYIYPLSIWISTLKKIELIIFLTVQI